MSTANTPGGEASGEGSGETGPSTPAPLGGPPDAPPQFGWSAPASYPRPAPGYDMPPPVPGVPPLPPGVTLAPAGRRIGAYFLSIVLAIVTLGIGYVIWGLIVWRRGTTPALSVLKMRCVEASTGMRATFGTMALREIVGRIVEGILGGITELVSLILFLSRDDRRCLHDLVAGTIVVFDPEGRFDATS